MSYCAAAVALGEILQRVSADVKDYVVDVDGDAAPPASLARACALMEAPEVTAAVARVATAVAHGAAVGASAGARMVTKRTSAGASSSGGDAAESDTLMESIVDALLEPKRLRAVSDFVGETSKSLLGAMVSVAKDNAEVLRAIAGFDDAGDGEAVERPSAADRAVAFLEKSKNKNLVVDFGRELVDAAMTTYVRTMGDDNMYADMFEAVRNPANKAVFLEMMHAMVETSVRTYVVASMEMAMHPDEMLRGGSYAASKRDDSPTSPLASRFTPVAQTPPRSNGVHDAHIDGEIHSPALFGTWKELFQAATETRENRRLVLATTGTATMAALRGFASGTYDVIFKGKFAGHRMHVQYWVLAVRFALASVVLLLFTRLFTLFALARLPT